MADTKLHRFIHCQKCVIHAHERKVSLNIGCARYFLMTGVCDASCNDQACKLNGTKEETGA
jgi:hypothetical protein